MYKVTVDAKSESDAIRQCRKHFGWTPDAVREVDSGREHMRSWLRFESVSDAETLTIPPP